MRKLQRTTTWQQRTFTRHTARGKCSPQVLFSPVNNPFQSPSVLTIRFLLNIFYKFDLFLQPQNIILPYFNEFTEIFYETKLSLITRILSIFLVIQLSLFYLASKTIQKELSRLSIPDNKTNMELQRNLPLFNGFNLKNFRARKSARNAAISIVIVNVSKGWNWCGGLLNNVFLISAK